MGVIRRGEKVTLFGVSAQCPNLVHVSTDNFLDQRHWNWLLMHVMSKLLHLEAQLKGALQDRVPGGPKQQLRAPTLRDGAH